MVDFNRPAGEFLGQGDFGNATMNNTQVMNGDRSAVLNLSRRFAAEVPSTINFAFDSAVLDGQARAVLSRQAEWIRAYPLVKFRVYGHTDMVGSTAYNRALGMRRARAAVDFMVSQGISRNRLEAMVSFGETQPLIVTEGRERRNRRTVTEVSGFLRPVPLVHDGKYAQRVYEEFLQSATEPGIHADAAQTSD
nr:OmpA family protein [Rhodovulum bhavnagarense]